MFLGFDEVGNLHPYLVPSLPHNQARPVHVGDDSTDVQDLGSECPHPGVQPVSAVPRRHQVQ